MNIDDLCDDLPGGQPSLKDQIASLDVRRFRVFQFDYRSNSYRLIGRIHACKEEWTNAVSALSSAVELSPDYAEGSYEYAQYLVQAGDRQQWVAQLRKAIAARPAYWYMASAERNFALVRNDVAKFLEVRRNEASEPARCAIAEGERLIAEAERAFMDGKTIFSDAETIFSEADRITGDHHASFNQFSYPLDRDEVARTSDQSLTLSALAETRLRKFCYA